MSADRSRSLAILIGNSAYRDPAIPDLPGAAACVPAMAALLAGDLCGWPADRIVTMVDISAPHLLAKQIGDAVRDVEDTLLVYYVGHGMRTMDGQLALAVGETEASPESLTYMSLVYDSLARIIQGCPAITKLIILDCCHAELAVRATGLLRPGRRRPDLAVAGGVYFIGASVHDGRARAPLDGGVTYFTYAFIDVVRSGIPEQRAELSIEQIFRALRDRLRAGGQPEPVQIEIRDAGDHVFARNAAAMRAGPWPPGTERRFQGSTRVSWVGLSASVITFLIALSSVFTGSWSSLGRSPAFWAVVIPFIFAAGWMVTASAWLVARPLKLRITPQLIEVSYGTHSVRCDWADLSRVTVRQLPKSSPSVHAVFVYPRPGVRVSRGRVLGPPRRYKKGWVMFCMLSALRAAPGEVAAALADFAGHTWDPAADIAVPPGMPPHRTSKR